LDVLKMQLQATPKSPRRVAPDAEIPEHVDGAIMRALEKNRDLRFSTAREFGKALSRAASPARSYVSLSRPAIAAHVPWLRSIWYWLRHHFTPQLLRVHVQRRWYRLPYPVRRWSPAGVAALGVLTLLVVLVLHRPATSTPTGAVAGPQTANSVPDSVTKP